jgi:hypothetical protein
MESGALAPCIHVGARWRKRAAVRPGPGRNPAIPIAQVAEWVLELFELPPSREGNLTSVVQLKSHNYNWNTSPRLTVDEKEIINLVFENLIPRIELLHKLKFQ